MIKSIKGWCSELLREIKVISSNIADIEERQRQTQSEIRQIRFEITKLSECVDDGWSNKPKKAILTKGHKEGSI